MDKHDLLDFFFEHTHDLNKEFIANEIFKYVDLDDIEAYGFSDRLQSLDGLHFAQRYRDHLPADVLYFAAATHGDLELAQWTSAHCSERPTFKLLAAQALRQGHQDVAFHLMDYCVVGNTTSSKWLLKCQIHDTIISMELLQTLATHFNVQLDQQIFLSPGMTLEMYEYLTKAYFDQMSIYGQSVVEVDLMWNPKFMMIKDMRLISELIDRHVRELHPCVVVNAIKAERDDVLQVIEETGYMVGMEILENLPSVAQVRRLFNSGLLSERCPTLPNPPLLIIIRLNDLSLLSEFHEQYGHIKKISSHRAMSEAASTGNVDIVRYIHENRPSNECNDLALLGAVWGGHLDVVKYLLEKINGIKWNLTHLGQSLLYGYNIDVVDHIIQQQQQQQQQQQHSDLNLTNIIKGVQYGYLPLVKAFIDKHLLLPYIEVDLECLLQLAYERGHLYFIDYFNNLLLILQNGKNVPC
ncbi:hypothetical protein SAMD00019534_063900 [Acytostelium subglobosum LB1]|uniref:hypothetical protein n=1 Tax=Acytostelium subglobosum LB1 TaxID=1410327 RepID=UPI0006450F8D|nr:hypothetical protein SAMD00019534_063900 [Acytostelium subglobosum LB1]GAM23215.1 hypothetical protein SAMD00019534_063900 [Acytostelium subglobosum LB1]|eukprot:XP_012753664.1 hypothetical protein SAMD00019534_063900 [Acytostelium subglobosum LB1]